MRSTLGVADSVLLAEDAAVPLEEFVAEDAVAFLTGDTMGMELLETIGLQVLSFDAAIAFCTEGIVVFVIVPRAVGVVAVDVEIDALEGGVACFADEALFVVTTCQLSIRGAY